MLFERRTLKIAFVEIGGEEGEYFVLPFLVVGAGVFEAGVPGASDGAECHGAVATAGAGDEFADFAGVGERLVDVLFASAREAATYGIGHAGAAAFGVDVIGASKRGVVGKGNHGGGFGRGGGEAEEAFFPDALAEHFEGFLHGAYAEADGDARGGFAVGRVGAAVEDHVAAGFVVGEIAFVDRRGESWLAREGVGHDERDLLVGRSELRLGVGRAAGRWKEKCAFDNNDQQLARIGSKPLRVSRLHFGAVEESHGVVNVENSFSKLRMDLARRKSNRGKRV